MAYVEMQFYVSAFANSIFVLKTLALHFLFLILYLKIWNHYWEFSNNLVGVRNIEYSMFDIYLYEVNFQTRNKFRIMCMCLNLMTHKCDRVHFPKISTQRLYTIVT